MLSHLRTWYPICARLEVILNAGVHRFPSYEIITEGIKGELSKAYDSQRLNKALISGPVTEVSNYNMERLTYLSG